MIHRALLLVALAISLPFPSLRADTISLDGRWAFALDPQRRGEASGWISLQPAKGAVEWPGWDLVGVPHCWSGDPRYEHTGAAWYVRQFEVPADWHDSHLRLRFASVGDRCRIWLNGQFVGAHDGVNLPFSFDITALARREGANVLSVEVDNSYNDHTIPGSRPGNTPSTQLYPWWNYGGILGDVALEGEAAARVAALKTDFVFKTDGSVALTLRASLENRGSASSLTITGKVSAPSPGAAEPVASVSQSVAMKAGESTVLPLSLTIPASQVQRWDLDHPALYTASVTLQSSEGASTLSHRIGLREIAIGHAQLLLNGQPIKVGGANRARGHPVWHGLEPRQFVNEEMTLMKNAHLEFARLQHYPVSQEMFDWADEHGMLIIAEAGNWGFTPAQLSSPEMRKLWQQHMRELMEASWDHPSVIGWSVGNEYISWVPEGIAWTRDMVAWVKQIDGSRPVTFAALGGEFQSKNQVREERSLHYVDFVCGNYYGSGKGIGPTLDRVHALWPEKPIMISEYGMRADLAKGEAERIRHFEDILTEVRARPYVCGLSYWAFNDYLSRYPNTTPNGYRAWGLVLADRKPRELYHVMKKELSPASLNLAPGADTSGASTLVVAARSDFPASILRGYTLRIVSADGATKKEYPVPTLEPGQNWKQPLPAIASGDVAELLRPGGFGACELKLDGPAAQ